MYLPSSIYGLPVSPTAPPKRIALSLLMGVMVCPKRADGLSPVNYAFSIYYQNQHSKTNTSLQISFTFLTFTTPQSCTFLSLLAHCLYVSAAPYATSSQFRKCWIDDCVRVWYFEAQSLGKRPEILLNGFGFLCNVLITFWGILFQRYAGDHFWILVLFFVW